MKISYDEDGFQGVVSCLSYLAAMSTEDIESDDFAVIGEDEQGREGYADLSIINLAEEACKALNDQHKKMLELETKVKLLSGLVRDNMESDNSFLTEWDKKARQVLGENN